CAFPVTYPGRTSQSRGSIQSHNTRPEKTKAAREVQLPNGSVPQPSTSMEVNTMTIAQITQSSKTDRPSVCTGHAPACPAPDVSPDDTATACASRAASRTPVPQ